jgi:hypothetical protein
MALLRDRFFDTEATELTTCTESRASFSHAACTLVDAHETRASRTFRSRILRFPCSASGAVEPSRAHRRLRSLDGDLRRHVAVCKAQRWLMSARRARGRISILRRKLARSASFLSVREAAGRERERSALRVLRELRRLRVEKSISERRMFRECAPRLPLRAGPHHARRRQRPSQSSSERRTVSAFPTRAARS